MLSISQIHRAVKSNKSIDPTTVKFSHRPVKSELSFIGDIHSDINSYKELSSLSKYSLQLGDLCNSSRISEFVKNKNSKYHKYIYGNHDWLRPDFIHPNHNLGDYGVWNISEFNLKIGYISGANSIDELRRKTDVYDPWHENEQLSYNDLQDAIDLLTQSKPDVIVSHMAPLCAHDNLRLYSGYGLVKSRTMMALESLFDEWQPTLWVFGHYHQNKAFNVKGTLFVCVDQNHILPVTA